ncbi:MAG: hypothetical protein KME17_26960 [Cyanosarcina radialis HA8281-LM2]|jgi:hypothetical protein|nr:hypothetical protein [Cyanosarcina radialis HA8281-LM2]
MQIKVTWQQSDTNPESADNFATISQWWASLDRQQIAWRQRLVPSSGDVSELNWESQRFDEVFAISRPQIRGITLYWYKPDSPQERNTTPSKLELDTLHQQLYIYPQSQKEVVYRVGIPEVVYQTLEIKNPQLELVAVGENYLLTLRDNLQKIEIKTTLNPENIDKIKQQLS